MTGVENVGVFIMERVWLENFRAKPFVSMQYRTVYIKTYIRCIVVGDVSVP